MPDILSYSFALTYAIMEEIVEANRVKVTETAPSMAALYTPTVTVAEQAKRLAPVFKK